MATQQLRLTGLDRWVAGRWRLPAMRRLPGLAVAGMAMLAAAADAAAQALPEGGRVAAGTAVIARPGPGELSVQQSSDRAVINWDSFSIGAGNRVAIAQPGATSVSVHQVLGAAPSSILGSLQSNGRVVLANPNGIWFGPTAHVDVAGILATTARMAPGDIDGFMAGGPLRLQQPGRPDAAVVNDGLISVADRGLAAFVAPGVANAGIIEARLGRVELAGGNRLTVDLNGDGLVELAADDRVLAAAVAADGRPLDAVVANAGRIGADGGRVLLRVEAAEALVDRAIDMSGVIQARRVAVDGGEIVLSGGEGAVAVAGRLDAAGGADGDSGGTVRIAGRAIGLADGARIDVSGAAGGGTAQVGGAAHGAGPGPRARTVQVAAGAAVAADAGAAGPGGTVVVWADGRTDFAGRISARGGAGGGDGGFVETSGAQTLSVADTAAVDTRAPRGRTGSWLLDPRNITVSFAGTAGLGDVAAFATSPSTDRTIAAATINAAASNVILQANTDITVNAPISLANAGIGLTLNAGRSIILNQNVTTNGGDFTATINDAGASAADRIAGQAAFTMQAGRTIATGGGAVQISTGSFGGGGVTLVGDMTVRNLSTSGGAVTLSNLVGDIRGNPDIAAGGGAISLTSFNQQLGDLTTTGNVSLTGTGAGTVTGNGQITANRLTLSGAATSFDLGSEDNPVQSITGTVGDIDFLDFSGFDIAGLTATGAGGATFTTDGTVTQSGPLSVQADTLTLNGGAGSFLLTDSGNRVLRLAGTVGSASFRGGNGYDVAGLTTFGDLTLSGDGTVTQSGAIAAQGLLLRGSAAYDFSTDINNSVTTIAADTSGSAKFTNAGALQVGTVGGVAGIATGTAQIRTLAGDLQLASGISASGGGTAIVVAAATDLVNAVGANALSAPNGRWLAYTRDRAGATFGGLDSGNTAI